MVWYVEYRRPVKEQGIAGISTRLRLNKNNYLFTAPLRSLDSASSKRSLITYPKTNQPTAPAEITNHEKLLTSGLDRHIIYQLQCNL